MARWGIAASDLYRDFTDRIEAVLEGLTSALPVLYGPSVSYDEAAVVALLSRADGVLQAWESFGALLVGPDDEVFSVDRLRLHRLYGVEGS